MGPVSPGKAEKVTWKPTFTVWSTNYPQGLSFTDTPCSLCPFANALARTLSGLVCSLQLILDLSLAPTSAGSPPQYRLAICFVTPDIVLTLYCNCLTLSVCLPCQSVGSTGAGTVCISHHYIISVWNRAWHIEGT